MIHYLIATPRTARLACGPRIEVYYPGSGEVLLVDQGERVSASPTVEEVTCQKCRDCIDRGDLKP